MCVGVGRVFKKLNGIQLSSRKKITTSGSSEVLGYIYRAIFNSFFRTILMFKSKMSSVDLVIKQVV